MILFKSKKNTKPEEEKEEQQNGGRNLCILGLGALIIAIITTSISLKIYHDTGDIYLDRSRPGYIFEDEKHSEKDDVKESFSSDGDINTEALDEYLESLNKMCQKVDEYGEDFANDSLSDLQLGIDSADMPTEESETSTE